MKFVIYNHWEQLPECADKLFAQGELDSLFFSRVWFETLTAHALAEPQSIRLVCVVEDESFLAILPMMMDLQGCLRSLSNNFTTIYSPFTSNGDQQDAIVNCLAEGLSLMPVQSIQFDPIDIDDGNMVRLQLAMESHGFLSYPYFRFFNWSHELNGQSFDDYMSRRPANLRNTIRRKQRKLEAEHSYDIRLYKDAGIDLALGDYHLVYQASWKANESYSDFTPDLVRSLSRLGWSRLAILYVNQQPVAAQIWFVVHGKANIYRLVYDEDWKGYSPGSILTQYLMRYVIDTDKVSEIDFLTGNERYKQDWMTIKRERLGFRFVKQPVQKNSVSRIIQSMRKWLSRD